MLMKISNWYTVRHHVLVHNWTDKKMCCGMSTGAVRWLVYEIVEENNIEDCNNVGFLDLSAILTINFSNKYF